MDRTRVMVVEDDSFMRSMIISALQMQNMDVVIESASASFAMKTAGLIRPEIAILDLNLGNGPTGIDLAIALRGVLPRIGILLLTSYEDPRLHRPNLPQLPAGAIYLQKSHVSKVEVLIEAVATALDYSVKRGKIVDTHLSRTTSLAKFTDIQVETMRLVAQGSSNSQIATLRGVSEKSVEQTISRLATIIEIKSNREKNQRVQITNHYNELSGLIVGRE
jgi:DNA-binding NarL/FixJ family response regulator